jgi:hypothetical protein
MSHLPQTQLHDQFGTQRPEKSFLDPTMAGISGKDLEGTSSTEMRIIAHLQRMQIGTPLLMRLGEASQHEICMFSMSEELDTLQWTSKNAPARQRQHSVGVAEIKAVSAGAPGVSPARGAGGAGDEQHHTFEKADQRNENSGPNTDRSSWPCGGQHELHVEPGRREICM